jgi:hypothetical protein
MRRGAAAGVIALSLVVGTAACGDDDGDDGPPTPGTETELDGGEAGTGGDTTTTQQPAGTDGGTTMGATEGNQQPPAG